jgi:hypothetical protein
VKRHITSSPPRGEVPCDPLGLPIVTIIERVTHVFVISVLMVSIGEMTTGTVVEILIGGGNDTPPHVVTLSMRVITVLSPVTMTIPSTSLTNIMQYNLLVSDGDQLGQRGCPSVMVRSGAID